MKRPGYLRIRADRYTIFRRVFRFRNRDLTGATAEIAVRLDWNTAGAALAAISTTPSGAGSIVFSLDGSDTLMTVEIAEATMEAMPFAAARADDLEAKWDCQIDPVDAAKGVWLRGPFIIQGGSVQ